MSEKKISDKEDFLETFDLAAAFCIQDLKDISIRMIRHNIGRYDPLELFNLGHFHACEELKKMSFAIIQKQFPDLRDEYIKAPNAINMLLTSIHQIDNFMPTEDEWKAQFTKDKLKSVTTKLKKLVIQKTAMTLEEQK